MAENSLESRIRAWGGERVTKKKKKSITYPSEQVSGVRARLLSIKFTHWRSGVGEGVRRVPSS